MTQSVRSHTGPAALIKLAQDVLNTEIAGLAAVRDRLRELMADEAVRGSQPEILGPAPAPVLKVNNRYRYRVFLCGKNDRPTRDRVAWLLREFGRCGENRGLNLFADCNAME